MRNADFKPAHYILHNILSINSREQQQDLNKQLITCEDESEALSKEIISNAYEQLNHTMHKPNIF